MRTQTVYTFTFSTSGDTKVRKPSVDAAPTQEPTPIRRGYWRNRWTSRVQIALHTRAAPGVIVGYAGPGEFLTESKFPTAELAEQRALENIEYHRASIRKKGIRYLGAVFFKEEGGES